MILTIMLVVVGFALIACGIWRILLFGHPHSIPTATLLSTERSRKDVVREWAQFLSGLALVVLGAVALTIAFV